MIKIIISLFFALILNADMYIKVGNLKNIEEKVPALQESLPLGLEVADEALKKALEKNVFFAKEYIKNSDELKLEVEVEEFLANKYQAKILESIQIEDEILKSYYLANLSKYQVNDRYDVFVVETESKEKAKEFQKQLKEDNSFFKIILSKYKYDKYSKVEYQNIPDSYRLLIKNLTPFEPSEIAKFSKNFVVIFYSAYYEKTHLKFEDVKSSIRNYLLNTKKLEAIKKELERLSKENKI